jgi:8-oxo-dGTP pyrophosphatase MutT (NUDIX family)
MHNSENDPWTWTSQALAYENPWITVEERRGLTPTGTPAFYGIVRFQRLAVGVLPIEADGTVHLVGQWRVPLNRYEWEMPEGGAEPGETGGIETAHREMAEEAGLACTNLVEVLRMDLSNSVTDEQAICYIATGLSRVPMAPDETEVLAHRQIPFMQALDEALVGQIRDSLTVATLLRAHHMAITGALDSDLAKAMLAE